MHRIVHLVRHFSPYGGMELFVRELVAVQLTLGYRVVVLCNTSKPLCQSDRLEVIEFSEKPLKPRWLEALRFGTRCKSWLSRQNDRRDLIIHSHERTWSQDIVTFHGQVYAEAVSRKPSKYISLRHQMNLLLERKQVTACNALVVPVSNAIRTQLIHHYGSKTERICRSIPPACCHENTPPRLNRSQIRSMRKVVGFIGQEWKRKGFAFALEVVEQYLHQYGGS